MHADDISGPYVIEGDCDDASSVATDDAPDADAPFPNKDFASDQELRAAVEAFVASTTFKICDNSRTRSAANLPTKWLKEMFQQTTGTVKYSGHLYCNHKKESCVGGGECTWGVPYKLQQNGTWTVLTEGVCWDHNHDVSPSTCPRPSASGIVHLRSVEDLSMEHKASILSYLETGIGVKRLRARFRAKYEGYELRARVCRTIKTQFLRAKYGADRHQIDLLLKKLQKDCNPAAGGVCTITHHENMEIAELYFQLPLLRAVGQYFGKLSVIDMTHNTNMYERNQATLNVSILNPCRLVCPKP